MDENDKDLEKYLPKWYAQLKELENKKKLLEDKETLHQ